MSHARWLTTANRILRLYVATSNPHGPLILLAEFVMKVYARVWFCIKTKPSCKYGGLHVWETINFSRYLDDSLRQIIDPVIQRNAFFAHPENMLLCMLVDDGRHVRELGLRRILKDNKAKLSFTVRQLEIPALNVDASDYTELID